MESIGSMLAAESVEWTLRYRGPKGMCILSSGNGVDWSPCPAIEVGRKPPEQQAFESVESKLADLFARTNPSVDLVVEEVDSALKPFGLTRCFAVRISPSEASGMRRVEIDFEMADQGLLWSVCYWSRQGDSAP